jgi:hypothetical protein
VKLSVFKKCENGNLQALTITFAKQFHLEMSLVVQPSRLGVEKGF